MSAGLKPPQDEGWSCQHSAEREMCMSLLSLASDEVKQTAPGREKDYGSL